MLEQKLGLRNVLRNRRRTLVTASIIVSSFSLMILFLGLSDGGHKAMIDIGIKMGVGHVVLYDDQYSNDPSLEHLIQAPNDIDKALRNTLGQSVDVSPRLTINALVQAGSSGVAVTLVGADAVVEEKVSKIGNRNSMISGVSLIDAKSDGAIANVTIGQELAKLLDVKVGEKITVTVKAVNSSEFVRAGFRVAGIFKTGLNEIDSFMISMQLSDAQALVSVGEAVTSMSIYLADPSATKTAALQMMEALDSFPVEVKRWDQEAPELYSAVTLDAAGMYLLMIIVYVVVAVSILNTILISVIKRKKEFGVLLALGARPWFVIRVVFWEAIFLGVICLSIGLAVGLAGHYHFATEGLNFKEIFGTTMEAGGVVLPDKFFSYLSVHKVIASLAFVFILTLIVTIYPAIKTSRLNPIEATR